MFVYILKNDHDETYVGQTKDIIHRLSLHNSKKVRSTKHGCPWKIIYTEKYESRAEAMNREKELKTGKGREWIHSKIIKKQ